MGRSKCETKSRNDDNELSVSSNNNNEKNSHFWKVDDRNTFQHVNNMMNHEQNNNNNDLNNIKKVSLNDIDQTVISDYVNHDGDDATNNMNIKSASENVKANDDNGISGLSKELNYVMSSIKEKNKLYGNVKVPTVNVDTTNFYSKVNDK